MKKFTTEELLTRVIKLSKKYPKAMYEPEKCIGISCSMTTGHVTDGPDCEGCIIGQAMPENREYLREHGLTRASVFELYFNEHGRHIFKDGIYIPALQSIQDLQDKGCAWNTCVIKTLKKFELEGLYNEII